MIATSADAGRNPNGRNKLDPQQINIGPLPPGLGVSKKVYRQPGTPKAAGSSTT